MNTYHYILAYHFDNHLVAAEIDQKLNRAGFQFDHIHTGNAVLQQTIAERLQNNTKSFILLLTDNFLKEENCLHKLLETISLAQKNNRQFMLILSDGFTVDPISNQIKSLETKLSTIGDILYYINYWQDKYLQVRKKYLDNDKSLQVVDERLKILREIAAEIGELLHKLRKLEPVSYTDFKKDNFQYFFSNSGNSESYDAYKKMAEYDHRDALIEQKVNNILENQLSPSTDELPEVKEYEFELEHIVSDQKNEEADQNTKGTPTEQQAQEKINNVAFEPDSDLLEKLKAYKNGLLKDESGADEKPDVEELKGSTEVQEDIFRSREELDAIIKLDQQVTQNLGSLLEEEKIHANTQNPKDTDDDDDWDEEEEELTNTVSVEQGLYEAIRLNPDNIEYRMQLIRYLIQDPDNFSHTADQLEQVLKLDKNNTEAIYLLASLSENVKEYELARSYYEKLVQLQPDFPGVYFKLAELIANHFPKNVETAAEYYKKAYQHDTTNIISLERRANIFDKDLKKPKKALKAYNKIIKHDPDHPTAYYHLAELSYELGDRLTAVSYYNKAKEITGRTKIQDEASIDHDVRIETEPITEKKMVFEEYMSIPDIPSKEVSSYVCITGATSGIGRALANLLASKSYDLILTGRRADRLLELANELKVKYDIGVEILQFDIRDYEQTSKAVESLGDKLDKVDVLINNAGLAMGLNYVHEANVEHWETMIDTNIKGLLYMTRLVTPSMVKRQRGHILNIGSTAGKEVYPKGNVYCATKFAVDALTKGFRQDLYQHNIRVSQVCPGHTEDTEFAITRFEGDSEKASIYKDFNPLKAENIADIIYFILTQPPNVNIQDVLVMSTQQAGSSLINRSGRIFDEDMA